ncbi:MAG: A24 family peptidase [Pirellulaceae bacterium]|nr:prepilin peptidase [Planctomycetales bacterium]
MLARVVLFFVGTFVGGQVNRGIYRLAWVRRDIGPWSRPAEGAPPRVWTDRIPVIGWWGLRREVPLHGRRFWIRPMLIELACGFALPWLYVWIVEQQRIELSDSAVPFGWLLFKFTVFAVLFTLMLIATFIDFDEKTIPDEITVTGVLLGLLVAVTANITPLSTTDGNLHAYAPDVWPADFDRRWGIVLGLAMALAWWLAVVPKTWTTRRGWKKAWQYLGASIVRQRIWWSVLGIVATLVLAGYLRGGDYWQNTFSSLVGITFGGGLVWAVRIIAGVALRREAMGFGDVTLMAMIGAFLGWQQTPAIFFFLAPCSAVLIAIVQKLVTGHSELAFGPYLCVGAAWLVLYWPSYWTRFGEPIFAMGGFVPAVIGVCLLLMAGMLFLLQGAKSLLGWTDEE